MGAHIAKDELVRLFSYDAREAEIHNTVAHIVQCPACWSLCSEIIASLKAAKALVPTRRGRPPAQTVRDPRNALVALMEIQEQRSIGLLRAKGWWAELKELSPREQAERIQSVAAVHKHEVFETIISEAKLVCGRDPFAAEHLAMSAHLLVDYLPDRDFSAHLKTGFRLTAMTVVANSRRLAGNWEGAFAAISRAQSYQAKGAVRPGDRAFLLSMHGALLSDTGRLEDALELLTQAGELYRDIGDNKELAAVDIVVAATFLNAAKPSEAIEMANAALALLAPNFIRLEMLARCIITESMLMLGRLAEALRSYEATRPLFEDAGGELTLLKAQYLEAKILDGLDHARESEKLFRSAIDGATEMEVDRLAFLFRFAFFESLFRRGALGKAAALCEESIERLQRTEKVHPQMISVWRELRATLQARALTTLHLAAVRDYLVRHWTAPAPATPFAKSN